MSEQSFSKGLAGVVADETSVSQVQGEVGHLIYRGIQIEDLAKNSTFEEVVFFLLKGHLPTRAEFEAFQKELISYRKLPQHAVDMIKLFPKNAHPMTILQSVLASLTETETLSLKNEAKNIQSAMKLVSEVGTIVAYASRHRRGLPFIEPRMDLTHAQNVLYMIHGKEVDTKEAKMFDTALILHCDHDFNASTFAGRVVGSTEAKLGASISAAVGALSGPLHGGANEKVLAMADEVGSPEKAKEWVMHALKEKKKVMGFGHRVYRTMDPRAKVLRSMLEELVTTKSNKKTYETLRIIHDTMIEELSKSSKDYIWPNVDFWSGAMYRLMDLETIDFTPIFAVARVSGWCSHIIEMWRDNRIYRPAAKYVGPLESKYTSIDSRK